MPLDEQYYNDEIDRGIDGSGVEDSTESSNRLIEELIRGQERNRQEQARELTEAEYKALADEIMKKGAIPKSLRDALQNGLGDRGINIDKLNELIKGSGMKLHLEATKDGLKLSLEQKGKIVDVENATTEAARAGAARMRGEAGRPGDNRRDGAGDRGGQPREIDEKDIANEIAKTGRIPDYIKKALEKGLNPNGKGLDLDKINKALEKMGSKHRLEITPGPNGGIQIELQKEGKVVDKYEATSPAAREAAERMRRRHETPRPTLPNRPADGGAVPPRPQDVLPPGILPHFPERPLEVVLATGDTLQIAGDKQCLALKADGAKLVLGDGKWELSDETGPVKVVPQYSLEIRNPQWNSLSNGGVVTFFDNRTEIKMPSGATISFDEKGVLSVTRDGKTETIRKPVERRGQSW